MGGHNHRAAGRLAQRVDEAIGRDLLIVPGEAVLVGVSGGPDSVALLHALAARAPRSRLRLGAAHLDHALRPESEADAEFVRRLCLALGLPFHLRRIDVRAMRRPWRLSLEEAARRARYDFFRETLASGGYTKLALAHHADDNAETVLLHLLRGSGRLGLGGIAPARAEHVIRPLIRVTRKDILAYLNAHGLTYRSDPTNADDSFLRNRIRHRLLPLLERDYQRGVAAVLGRTAEILRDEEDWIGELLAPVLARVVIRRGAGYVTLAAGALREMPPAAARRVLRSALSELMHDLRRVAFGHIDRLIGLAEPGAGAGPLHLPGGIRARRSGEELILTRAAADPGAGPRQRAVADFAYELPQHGSVFISETGDRMVISEAGPELPEDPAGAGPLTAFLDAAVVRFPVVVRNFRPGDRFHPLGAGGSQKLKKFFSDHKVPPAERRRCPLLVSGGRILWVGGHRIDQSVRLTTRSRRALRAQLVLAPAPAVINTCNSASDTE